MKRIKRVTALAGSFLLLTSSLTGCSTGDLSKIENLPNQSYKTYQEVMDDAKEASNYSNFSQRTAVTDYKAQFNATTQENQDRCLSLLQKVLVEHNLAGEDTVLEYVSEANHDYLKAVLDDYQLANPSAQSLKEFSGYYFLTVDFDTYPNTLGKFKNYANYVGLDNCILRYSVDEWNSIDTVDPNWITQITNYMNSLKGEDEELLPLFVENIVTEEVVFEEQSEEETPIEGEEGTEGEAVETVETAGVTDTETEGTDEEDEGYTAHLQDPETDEGDNGVYEVKRAIGDLDVYSENLRHMMIDVDEYEDLFGASASAIAYMPDLDYVYQTPEVTSSDYIFAGNGCYNEGINGLREYGFDREKNTGKIEITFVFSQDEINKDDVIYIFPYIESYKSDYDFGPTDIVNIPEFAEEQLQIKVEELDRLINNVDINGLMKQYTIEDAGLAFRLAQFGNTADINEHATKYLGCVGRSENSYLVKVETTVAERPTGLEFVSQYKDTYYYVIRQKDLNFYINDIWLQSREMTKQPTIYEISPAYRQLVALNLSGEVTDEQKATITEEVFDKYMAYVEESKLGSRGGTSGIMSLFDEDASVLSDISYDYFRSRIQSNMQRYGNYTPHVTIVPVEWIGGYETQVELTTKELIEYDGIDQALYLENYYVLSHFGNKWVIDDIQQITERELEGEDYAKVKQGFTSGSTSTLSSQVSETTAESESAAQ